MKNINYNETINIKVDLHSYLDILELEKELIAKKIKYQTKTLNKYNRRTEFTITTSITEIINKQITSLIN